MNYQLITFTFACLSIASLVVVIICLLLALVNRYMHKNYKFRKTLIVFSSIFVISIISTFIARHYLPAPIVDDMLPTPPHAQDFGIDKTYTYHDFVFPFELDEEKVTDSLMNGSTITVENPTNDQVEALLASRFTTGWRDIDYAFYQDGGSKRIKSIESTDKPGVEIFYKWDMGTGTYSRIEIKFIHPADIKVWCAGKC